MDMEVKLVKMDFVRFCLFKFERFGIIDLRRIFYLSIVLKSGMNVVGVRN